MDFAIGRQLQTLLREKSLNVMIQTTTIQSGDEFADERRYLVSMLGLFHIRGSKPQTRAKLALHTNNISVYVDCVIFRKLASNFDKSLHHSNFNCCDNATCGNLLQHRQNAKRIKHKFLIS